MNFSASEYVTSVCSTSAPNTTATYAPRRTSSSQPNSTARLNMKQNTAYGASLMTRPIRVIETSNRPSMPRRRISMPGVVLLTTMTTPNISAKNNKTRIEELLEGDPVTLSCQYHRKHTTQSERATRGDNGVKERN